MGSKDRRLPGPSGMSCWSRLVSIAENFLDKNLHKRFVAHKRKRS
jgi:hypothetical protein